MSRDALIVGINQYQSLPVLNAPASDAAAVADCLQTQGEFRVHRLPEVIKDGKASVGRRRGVTTQALESALIQLLKPKGKNIPTTALFYFSGHGLQRDAGIQEGYLATSDADPSHGNFGISLFWLRRLLQQSPVRQLIVILDCCHSGELFTFSDADPGARAGTDYLLMAASREYESAYESLGSEHSIFTQALLSGLNPYDQASGKVSNYSLSEHVSQQLRGEIQQPLFESSGSEIVLTRIAGSKAAFSIGSVQTFAHLKKLSFGFCPYQGLAPFEETHADYFFGRAKLTAQLLRKVGSNNFCALVGASSSGKTSLLCAGLMHQLRRGSSIAGSDSWSLKLLTPTQQPIKALAAVFVSENADNIQRAGQMRQAELLLQDGGSGLAQLVRAALLKPGQTSIPTTFKLWLIIDQFEELFTHTADETAIAERELFIRCLTEALREPGTPLGIVIGLRADAMQQLLPHTALKTLVEQNAVLVNPMTYDQIKAVVQKPAEKIGLELDPTMLYTLAIDTNGAPGELPLIQETLLELWRRRELGEENTPPRLTMDAYIGLGGVRNVIARRATAVYESLNEDMQRAARRIFLGLCELGEGQTDRRRRVFRSELINESFPAELIDRTLNKLAAERLVTLSQAAIATHSCCEQGIEMPDAAWQTQRDESSPLTTWFLKNVTATTHPVLDSPQTVDIVHECLVQDWLLLRTWLAESRSMTRQQRQLEISAQAWEQRRRPTSSGYLLGGTQLQESLAFLQLHRDQLSSSAQAFIHASRKARNRLRLQTGLLVPAALGIGMATSAFSRFVFPPVLEPLSATDERENVELPSPTAIETVSTEDFEAEATTGTADLPPENTRADANMPPRSGLWQKGEAAPAATSEDAAPFSAALSDDDYVMVPAGKWASPTDPDKLVEVWWIQPRGMAAPMSLQPAAVSPSAVTVGVSD